MKPDKELTSKNNTNQPNPIHVIIVVQLAITYLSFLGIGI